MTILKEIIDGIAIVADAIKNINEIHTAIKDGKKYFEKAHPEIKQDVIGMCAELQKTCNAIATASSVITNFKFNSSAGALDGEPTRFNNYFISYKTNKNEAEDLIRSLKGHCYIIREHAEKITQGKAEMFWSFFGLQSQQRETDLGALLQQIYNDEASFFTIVYHMAQCMNSAIEDVTNSLTIDCMMHSSKVPAAALKLNEYSAAFKKLELLSEDARDAIDATIQELQ